MKNNNNYNGIDEKRRKNKAFRKKQLKMRMFICILIFGSLCMGATPIGSKVAQGKKEIHQRLGKEVKIKKAGILANSNIEKNTVKKIPNEKKKQEIDIKKPMVALTFDDGPGARTMELLKVLEKYDARATFFTCGISLNRNKKYTKQVLNKMKDIGCDISNHTMEHKQLGELSKQEIKYQVSGVNKIIKKYTGENGAQLRPPYGDGIHKRTVKKNVGMPMIYWSIDTLDWKTKSKDKTVRAIMKNVQDGDIVLMHDIHSWSVDAAIEVIPKLIKKGYQLVTVSEMAEARGIKLKNGKTYFDFRP